MLGPKELKNIYSNEQVLLLLLARLYFSTATRVEVSDFIEQHPVNWGVLYKIARAHGVRPFIHHSIFQHQITVDAAFAIKLQNDHQIAKLQGVRKAVIIAKLVKEFSDKGIIIIPYKGPVFAHSYYEHIGLRESSDIDFLVNRKDVAKIEDHFITNGYKPKETVPRSYLRFYQKFFKDIIYTAPENNYAIEIHWGLTNRFAGGYPAYSFFAPYVKPYQLDVLQLHNLQPPYDFMAIVSNHFVKDMSIRFKYIIDIACLLNRHPQLSDDPMIFSTAKKYGFKKKLEAGLSLVNDLLGVCFHPAHLLKLPDHYLTTPLRYPILLPRLQFNEAAFLKRSLQLQDNLVNKCKFLVRSFLYTFIPSYIDINTFKLPVYFLPVLAIFRPFRLLLDKIKAIRKK